MRLISARAETGQDGEDELVNDNTMWSYSAVMENPSKRAWAKE
jgi:hypothetical protein